MSNGPQYRNGQEITFGGDGRWWLVTSHHLDGLYGYPMSDLPTRHHHTGHKHYLDPRSKHYGTGHNDHHHAAHLHAAQARGIATIRGNRINRHQTDDPWQGNDFARELFQGQGANYFIGANHLVTVMAEAYAAAYTAAFFAPEIIATGRFAFATSRMGILGNAFGRVFWSGGIAIAGARAAALADEEGGMTLEMTSLGQWIDSVVPDAMWLWKLASAGFARGAEGTIISVQGDVLGTKSVWGTIEYGILLSKNEIRIYSATGRW